MADPRPDSFPRPVLWVVGAMVAFTILAAGLGRMMGATQVPVSTAIETRDLRFADMPNGDVAVTDAATNRLVQTITGQAGFLRGTVRGLASERLRAGLDQKTPFRLTAWKDGRLTLDDPTDKRHIELEAFGPTNEAVFAGLLQGPPK